MKKVENVEKDLSKESLIVIPGRTFVVKPGVKKPVIVVEKKEEDIITEDSITMPTHDVDILEEIKADMYVMGKTYVSAFNIVSGITAVRAANMSYRCAMQAIRDKVRYLTPKGI
jgi:hypothetical protein